MQRVLGRNKSSNKTSKAIILGVSVITQAIFHCHVTEPCHWTREEDSKLSPLEFKVQSKHWTSEAIKQAMYWILNQLTCRNDLCKLLHRQCDGYQSYCPSQEKDLIYCGCCYICNTRDIYITPPLFSREQQRPLE